MAYDYLHLVNRLCYKLNEVPLTSSTFANADGVYNDFKSAVNAAIKDICSQQDVEWPFLHETVTFVTTVGTHEYNKDSDLVALDWDSFYIKRKPLTIASITQSSGTATATVSAGHQLVTGDSIYISGATQSGYNGDFEVTVSSATVFTFSVDSSTVSPATGTPVLYPPYSTKKLTWIDYDKYRKEGQLERDIECYRTDSFSVPEVVVRKLDNNFIISPKPDRIYTIEYEGFTTPTALSTYTDVPIIPEFFEETIINGAIVHGYFFRDNLEQTAKAEDTYKDNIVDMRRILIPQSYYMRVSN